jgi:predicted thioesterase
MPSIPSHRATGTRTSGTLTIRYLQPAPTGKELVIEARHEQLDGRKLHLTARAWVGHTPVADATAVFIQKPDAYFTGDCR